MPTSGKNRHLGATTAPAPHRLCSRSDIEVLLLTQQAAFLMFHMSGGQCAESYITSTRSSRSWQSVVEADANEAEYDGPRPK